MTTPEEDKKDRDTKYLKEDPFAKQYTEFLRTHRVIRTLHIKLIQSLWLGYLFLTPKGRDHLRDPLLKTLLFNREQRSGFLENSILNPQLYHPNKGGLSLELSSAPAGRWVGFDFYRPKEFGLKQDAFERQKYEGKLAIADLPEIKDNDASQYTPTNLYELFDIVHILSMEHPPVEKVVEKGYLKETTYGEAFDKVGLLSKYKATLILNNLVDEPLYAVTPKGNGVVFVFRDSGKRMEKPKTIPELKPALQT